MNLNLNLNSTQDKGSYEIIQNIRCKLNPIEGSSCDLLWRFSESIDLFTKFR